MEGESGGFAEGDGGAGIDGERRGDGGVAIHDVTRLGERERLAELRGGESVAGGRSFFDCMRGGRRDEQCKSKEGNEHGPAF